MDIYNQLVLITLKYFYTFVAVWANFGSVYNNNESLRKAFQIIRRIVAF